MGGVDLGGGAPPSWEVRRAWIPRLGRESLWTRFRRRFRRVRDKIGEGAEPDVDPGCLDVFGEGILIGLAILVAVLFVAFIGLPLLFALLDVVLLLVLGVLTTLVRVLFRRPWRIEAHSSDGTTLHWDVVGWRASSEKIDEVRASVAAGIVPPTDSPA
jgi:hypothetical protein